MGMNTPTYIKTSLFTFSRLEYHRNKSWVTYSAYNFPINVYISMDKSSQEEVVADTFVQYGGESLVDPRIVGASEEEVLNLVIGYIFTVICDKIDVLEKMIENKWEV
ncbi:MAG: hypothetical protein DRI46_10330 [Chloroflexi bacterium]|nr:MAG: hypothetical protein DRI46_10330 [Chloroflexota bacterium]